MSNIRYYLLLTANPLSDSKAAKQIFSTIKQLDILSRDLKIFMPGFHGNDYKEQDSVSVVTKKINSMVEHNKDNHGDYHGSNAVYHTYCPSAGDMYFNDADFAQFMLDLEDRCPNFEYLGKTEMVLLPTHKGIILYDKVKCFNLEPFFEAQRNNSLEEFLMSSLRILLKGENRTSLSCMDEIEHLYNKKVDAEVENDTSTVSIRIDNWILKHMNWKEHDALIDSFIEAEQNGELFVPKAQNLLGSDSQEDDVVSLKKIREKAFLSESLAKIYVKQHKYEQALAIFSSLNLKYSKKYTYFADQIRYLETVLSYQKGEENNIENH